MDHIFTYGGRDDAEARPDTPSQDGRCSVVIRTSTGRARRVELPRSQLEGKTPAEIFEAAIEAIEHQAFQSGGEQLASDMLFAQDVRFLVAESGFALEARSENRPLPLNRKIAANEVTEIVFDLGVDHVGGQ
jgi:hypothetical protein